MKTFRGTLEEPEGGGVKYPGRYDVRAALLVSSGDRVPVVVKTVRRRWYELAGSTSAERALRVAMHLMRHGIPTPEPLGIEVLASESRYVCRLVDRAQQVRWWFWRRDDPSVPEALPGIDPEDVIREVGFLARRLHDAGVFFRDLTDGNILVSPEPGGRFHLWLVDLSRARVGSGRLGWIRRARDLSRLGINQAADRKLLLDSYTSPAERPAWVERVITLLRKGIRLRDQAKVKLRPWRRRAAPWKP